MERNLQPTCSPRRSCRRPSPGVAWGILGGALPGISPSITMALLLPFTYGMDPTPALVMLASTYVGAEYGGSIPAILIRTPGTNAAAATVIDGYMHEAAGQGRRGARHIRSISGFIGGLVGLICLVLHDREAVERGARVQADRPISRSASSACR